MKIAAWKYKFKLRLNQKKITTIKNYYYIFRNSFSNFNIKKINDIMKKIIILSLAVFFIAGCEQKKIHSRIANVPSIEKTIQRAKNGIVSANDTVSTLLGLSLFTNKNYNKLKIDSLNLKSGKYFTILIEYPNPVNNKFGIYNDSLKTLLIDKSLYGELSEDIITVNGKKYIKVNEGFTIKNVYKLSRLSLYEIIDKKAYLIFRTFTRLEEPGELYTQVVNEISNSRIITKINSTNEDFDNKSDIFEFDKKTNSYISQGNLFYNFVKNELHKLPQDGSLHGDLNTSNK